MAFTVLCAPTERVFGMAIVGMHHDPFTVMAHFDGAPRAAIYLQPVTDLPGEWIARVTGGVAAYNWIVLLSFPLAAASVFLLARYLSVSAAGATLAAMAFAFSPFHIAHAAYHPHIAQVQWIPLFLLALWRCLDRASLLRVALLVGAAVLVTLSNFYGGLIAAMITPVAIGARALFGPRETTSGRNFAITLGALACIAAAGVAYVAIRAPELRANPAAFAFRAGDVATYSATMMSFVTPPVAHPLFGAAARRSWEAAGVGDGLLEQQVYLGWSLIALALIAAAAWAAERRGHAPVLVCVAAAAVFFAIWPPAWLYDTLPMFRSYARFGAVVQLMTAVMAGIGFDRLWRSGKWQPRAAAAALAVILAIEFMVSPADMSRRVPAAQRTAIESWHRITQGAK